eukprot:5836558-Amphidinium_carterae.1
MWLAAVELSVVGSLPWVVQCKTTTKFPSGAMRKTKQKRFGAVPKTHAVTCSFEIHSNQHSSNVHLQGALECGIVLAVGRGVRQRCAFGVFMQVCTRIEPAQPTTTPCTTPRVDEST